MVLQPVHSGAELRIRVRERALEVFERLRRPDARDDVLSLGVDQELAAHDLLTGCRIAREGDARRRMRARVSEHHLDDVDGGSDRVGDLVQPAVHPCARVLPGAEDGLHRLVKLGERILWKRSSECIDVDALVRLHELFQIVRSKVRVGLGTELGLPSSESFFEEVSIDAVDDLSVHLNQTAVGVVGEMRVTRCATKSLSRGVGEAEVEDAVHHPRHRDRRTRAHRDEQRVVGRSEVLARLRLQSCDRTIELVAEPRRDALAVTQVIAAGVRGDREARGNR